MAEVSLNLTPNGFNTQSFHEVIHKRDALPLPHFIPGSEIGAGGSIERLGGKQLYALLFICVT